MSVDRDAFFMQRALVLAQLAAVQGEVPVGAVVTLNDEVIGEGYNSPIQCHDPSAHAEIIALRAAADKLGNYRLLNTTLYVTLEPCLMCAGAMVHARVRQLVYGASDPKAGAVQSQSQCLNLPFLNHRVVWTGGVLAQPCSEILTQFFQERR